MFCSSWRIIGRSLIDIDVQLRWLCDRWRRGRFILQCRDESHFGT